VVEFAAYIKGGEWLQRREDLLKAIDMSLRSNESGVFIYNKEAILSLPRHYIITQLRNNGFKDLANSLPQVPNPDDPIHGALQKIAATLNEERQEQFDDMLLYLNLTSDNLKETFDSIVNEMLRDSKNWGRIITFVVFVSHLVLYCARQKALYQRVPEVMQWTDSAVQEKMQGWIEKQGGWQACLEHYDLESWRISLSTFLLGMGGVLALATAGLAFFKNRPL